MTITKKWLAFIPFLILLLLLFILWQALFNTKPNEIASPLIGEDLPHFKLPLLFQPQKILDSKDIKGEVSLINVWASWCYACSEEAQMLTIIKEKYHVPIYGIVYKDNEADAKQWLQSYGYPYTTIADDRDGNATIELGVYGIPETFIISKEGKILYRHTGSINQKNWDEVLYPLIKKYSTPS